MFLRFMLLILVSFSVFAGELDDGKVYEKKETENFCINPQDAIDNETLARDNPYDVRLVKLVALRAGLCDLIAKEIIDLDFAIDLFNKEHNVNIMERLQEEREANNEIGV